MRPLKATYIPLREGEADLVTVIKIIPGTQASPPLAAFIDSKGNLAYGELQGFHNCHYEDEYVPIERLGTSK